MCAVKSAAFAIVCGNVCGGEMGNVCGAEAPVNESDVQLSDGKQPAMPAPGLHRSMSNVQVTELIDALVSTALPLVRKMISKKLIHQGLIVKNEEPVENFNPLDMPFEPFTGLGSRLPATPPCPLAPALHRSPPSPPSLHFSGWPLLFGPATLHQHPLHHQHLTPIHLQMKPAGSGWARCTS